MSAFDPARSLQKGWETLKTHTAPMLLGALIVDFLSGRLGSNFSGGGGGGGGNDVNWDPPAQDTGELDFQFQAPQDPIQQLEQALQALDGAHAVAGSMMLIGLVCFGLFSLVWLVARCFILGGWYRLHIQALREDDASFNHLFSGGEVLGPMVKLKLLESIIYGAIVLFAFGAAGLTLYLGRSYGEVAFLLSGLVGFALSAPLAGFVDLRIFAADRLLVIGGMTATQALGASWRLTGANLLGVIVFLGAMVCTSVVVVTLSCCLCCFGFLVTIPLRAVIDTAVTDAVTQAWEQFSG